jgi:hypothetical protein
MMVLSSATISLLIAGYAASALACWKAALRSSLVVTPAALVANAATIYVLAATFSVNSAVDREQKGGANPSRQTHLKTVPSSSHAPFVSPPQSSLHSDDTRAGRSFSPSFGGGGGGGPWSSPDCS